MVLEKTVKNSGSKKDGDMLYKSHQTIGHADDLVVIAGNKKEIRTIIQRLIEEAW